MGVDTQVIIIIIIIINIDQNRVIGAPPVQTPLPTIQTLRKKDGKRKTVEGKGKAGSLGQYKTTLVLLLKPTSSAGMRRAWVEPMSDIAYLIKLLGNRSYWDT